MPNLTGKATELRRSASLISPVHVRIWLSSRFLLTALIFGCCLSSGFACCGLWLLAFGLPLTALTFDL
jgi:hypothetical protein